MSLSPKTRERYAELARNQIVPHLGHHKLTALKAEHVERWHAALAAKGLAPRTIGHAHRLLSLVLKRGVRFKKLAENVASLCNPPKVESELEIARLCRACCAQRPQPLPHRCACTVDRR